MFEKTSDIAPFLADAGLDAFAGVVADLCVPVVCFEDRAEAPAAQFGGAPLVPPGFAWPRRDAYPHGDHLARELGRRGPELAQAFVAPAHLDFLCQVDLAPMARTGALGDKLPAEGSLLFFWDATCGPWIDSAEAARVVWDRTLASGRIATPPPQALTEALARVGRMGFRAAVRGTPLAAWSLPHRVLMQHLIAYDDVAEALTGDEADDFWDSVVDVGLDRLTSGRAVLPHRLGGWPVPEQWDPRATAAAAARGTLRHFDRVPSDEEQAACDAEMHDWSLLLQVSLAALGTDFAEGTVYFVLRNEDLAARDFSRVHAIYQQT